MKREDRQQLGNADEDLTLPWRLEPFECGLVTVCSLVKYVKFQLYCMSGYKTATFLIQLGCKLKC